MKQIILQKKVLKNRENDNVLFHYGARNSVNEITLVGIGILVVATNWQFSYHHPKPLSDRVLVFNSFFLSSLSLFGPFFMRDRKSAGEEGTL